MAFSKIGSFGSSKFETFLNFGIDKIRKRKKKIELSHKIVPSQNSNSYDHGSNHKSYSLKKF